MIKLGAALPLSHVTNARLRHHGLCRQFNPAACIFLREKLQRVNRDAEHEGPGQ